MALHLPPPGCVDVLAAGIAAYLASPPPPKLRVFRPRPAETDEALIARLMRRVDTSGDCWIWLGATNNHGYGRHNDGLYVHRTFYRVLVGPVGDEQSVCHRCDNPPCCRPSHLFLGTASDNMRDMVAKGRHVAAVHPEAVVRGERVHGAKLTEEQVREIRRRYIPYVVGTPTLAREFGVDHRTIHSIVTGRSWTHVQELAS